MWVEALICCMISAGTPAKRAPHMLLAGAGAGELAGAGGFFSMRKRLALSTALAALLVVPAALADQGVDQGPPIAGSVENFSRINPSLPAPDDGFSDVNGHSLSLADFRGKYLLLNLWATWCGPCVAEMPSLDRLQAVLGSANFAVLPISVDRGG